MTARYRSYLGLLFFLALCAGCVLLAANVLLGDLNQDEGWYLYAARMVRSGNLPYRDFAYAQAPVMPFVYALVEPYVEKHGLVAGRWFTALLGLAGALMAAALAARLAAPRRRAEAALLALVLVLLNVYQAYFTAVVKTYALTSFFLLAGFLVLSFALDRRSCPAMMLSSVLLVLAAGTRTSAGVVMPVVLLFLVFDRGGRSFFGWLYFGLGGLLAGCAIALPFLITAPQAFWFWNVSYHTLRDSGGALQSLIYKAGFVSRLLGAYFVAVGLCLAVVLAGWFRRRSLGYTHAGGETEDVKTIRDGNGPVAMIWVCVAAVSCVHILAPFPYDDYQVFIFPVFAVAVAVAAVRVMSPSGAGMAWMLCTVFALCLGSSISSPINQDWFVQGRDRIWWRLKEQTPLRKLRETGDMIRSMTGPGELLLTQDPYLAVESGLVLPRGLEMGQFSYFPDLSDETAERLHVLNRLGMKRLLKECDAPVAALSGYAFAIRSPGIEPVTPDERDAFWAAVLARYEPFRDIPDFGQAFTTLRILRASGASP